MIRELKLIWTLVAATLAAIVVTYSRLPAAELYNVSGSGLRAGLGRAVVDLNFPDALIALAVLGVVGPCLTPLGRKLALVAAVLCAVGPAFVRQGDLDVGFQSSRIVSYHGNAPHHAVHHGMHHGLYGLLLVATALLLSRLPNRLSPLLALLLAYSVGNMLDDIWLEQVAERGWTSWTIPSCLEPGLTWTWLGVLLATPVLWFTWFRAGAAATDAEADLRRTRSAAQPS